MWATPGSLHACNLSVAQWLDHDSLWHTLTRRHFRKASEHTPASKQEYQTCLAALFFACFFHLQLFLSHSWPSQQFKVFLNCLRSLVTKISLLSAHEGFMSSAIQSGGFQEDTTMRKLTPRYQHQLHSQVAVCQMLPVGPFPFSTWDPPPLPQHSLPEPHLLYLLKVSPDSCLCE